MLTELIDQMDLQVKTTATPTVTPLVRELPADLETPVSTYLKLSGEGPSFLLESVSGGEQVARYSFIGVEPKQAFVLRGQTLETHSPAGIETRTVDDPLQALAEELARMRVASVPGLPRFAGGLAGYLSYEMMRFYEPSVALSPHADLPDAVFLLADTLVAFDHAFGKLLLIANPNPELKPAAALAEAEARLDALQARLAGPLPAQAHPPANGRQPATTEMQANLTREQFCQAVIQAKEHIAAGDIFQVVLSQRLSRETTARPFDIYRALRRLNPSPYMFFFDFATLAGGEPLTPDRRFSRNARASGRAPAAIRPIAGTRPRGKTPAEDAVWSKNCWPTRRSAPSTSCWSTWRATTWAGCASMAPCTSPS